MNFAQRVWGSTTIDLFPLPLSSSCLSRSIITRKTWVGCVRRCVMKFILNWSTSNRVNKMSLTRSWWIVLVQTRFVTLFFDRGSTYKVHIHSYSCFLFFFFFVSIRVNQRIKKVKSFEQFLVKFFLLLTRVKTSRVVSKRSL